MLNYRLDNFFGKGNKINKGAILDVLIKHLMYEAHSFQYRIRDTSFMNTYLIKKHVKEEVCDYIKKNDKTELNISEDNIYKIADNIEIAGLKTADTVKVEVQQITKQDYEKLELKVNLIGADNMNIRQINGLFVSLITSNGRIEKLIIYATEIIADTVNNELGGYYADEIKLIDGTVISSKDTNNIVEENIKKLQKLLNEIDTAVDKYSAVILNAILDKYLISNSDIKNYIGEFIKSNKNYRSKAQNSLMRIYNIDKLMSNLDYHKDNLANVLACEIHFETNGFSHAVIRSSSYDDYKDMVLEVHIAITIPPNNNLITKKSLQKIVSFVESYIRQYRNGEKFKARSYCMEIQGIQEQVYFQDLNFLLNNYSKFKVEPARKTPGLFLNIKQKFKVDLDSISKEDKKSLWWRC